MATVKRYLIVRREGTRDVRREVLHYNLDVILAVGYRVRSHRGTTFRQLADGRFIGDMVPGNRIPSSRISQVSQRLNGLLKKGYLPTVKNPDGTIPLRHFDCKGPGSPCYQRSSVL